MRCVPCLLLLLSAPAILAAPATPPGAPSLGDVAASVERLDATLAEMVVLLRQQVAQQEMALVMNRIELGTFVLMDANRRLEAKRDEREGCELTISSLEDEDMKVGLIEHPEMSAEERELQQQMAQRMARELAIQRERLKRLDLEVVTLENEAGEVRAEMGRWQEKVDEWFEKSGRRASP